MVWVAVWCGSVSCGGLWVWCGGMYVHGVRVCDVGVCGGVWCGGVYVL